MFLGAFVDSYISVYPRHRAQFVQAGCQTHRSVDSQLYYKQIAVSSLRQNGCEQRGIVGSGLRRLCSTDDMRNVAEVNGDGDDLEIMHPWHGRQRGLSCSGDQQKRTPSFEHILLNTSRNDNAVTRSSANKIPVPAYSTMVAPTGFSYARLALTAKPNMFETMSPNGFMVPVHYIARLCRKSICDI